MHVVYFGAQGGQQVFGDGIASLGSVQLQDANVAGRSGGDVRDADERFRLGGVETAEEGGRGAVGGGGG